MFCPMCKAEYREGITNCKDCDVNLVEALLVERKEADEPLDLVRLWRGPDPVLYPALKAALVDSQIPIFDNPPRDYENWLSARSHTGLDIGLANFDIQVPREHFDAADEILQAILNGLTRPTEEGT